MKNLKGDLLTVTEGYICHQVNTEGIMGAGIALQIKNKWPQVFKDYKRLCELRNSNTELLGATQIIRIIENDKLNIINLFGQRLNTNERPTRYDAVADAFEYLFKFGPLLDGGSDLYIPKLMGCDLGGGDWNIYLAIIINYFPQVNIVDYERGVVNVYDPNKNT